MSEENEKSVKETSLVENNTSEKKSSATDSIYAVKKERSWSEAASDVTGAVIDSLASGKRPLAVLFSGLGAAFNTPGFQTQKNYSERQNLALQMAKTDMRRQQIALDNEYRRGQDAIIRRNVQNQIAANPQFNWSSFTAKEQEDILNSPAVRSVAEFNYLGRELLRSRNDPQAWGRVKRYIEDAGGKVIGDGKNFKAEYGGRVYDLNEKTGLELNASLQNTLAQEIQARQSISYNSSKGNVMGKIESDYARKIMPYTSNSALGAVQRFNGILKNLTESQRLVMAGRKTIEDYINPALGNDEKMAEVEMFLAKNNNGLSLLNKMGYNFNPGMEGAADGTFVPIDNPNAPPMTIPQFLMHLKEKDTGSAIIEQDIEVSKRNYDLQQKLILARQMKNTGDMLGDGSKNNEAISDAENRYGLKQLGGSAWAKMTPAMKRSYFNAQDEIANYAVYKGLASFDGKRLILNRNLTQKQIDEMRAIERNVYERLGMGDYADNGFWAKMQNVKNEKGKFSSSDRARKDEYKTTGKVGRSSDDNEILENKYGQTLMNK